MQALRGGQILVNCKAPDMLNMRIDKGGEASVAVKTSDIRIWEILQKACRIWTDTGRRDDIQLAVILKLLAGRRIENGDNISAGVNEIPEVTRFLQRRGNRVGDGALAVLLVPLLAVMAEGTVATVL